MVSLIALVANINMLFPAISVFGFSVTNTVTLIFGTHIYQVVDLTWDGHFA
jgi:hypothetical protein